MYYQSIGTSLYKIPGRLATKHQSSFTTYYRSHFHLQTLHSKAFQFDSSRNSHLQNYHTSNRMHQSIETPSPSPPPPSPGQGGGFDIDWSQIWAKAPPHRTKFSVKTRQIASLSQGLEPWQKLLASTPCQKNTILYKTLNHSYLNS